jgi:peptide/nickel transport system permease protein
MKQKLSKILKFYLIPFWRDPELTVREYEIGKIKSKRKMFARFLNPLTIIGFLLIFFVGVLAVYPQWITEWTLDAMTSAAGWGDPWQLPSPDHPLGTTKNGYDILGRLIWGARSALTIGMQSNLISIIGGVVLGLVSAYFGGLIDQIIMRVFDVIMALPGFILALLLVSMLGSSLKYLLMAYGIIGIPGYARFLRSSVLYVKQNVYIEAAKTSGSNDFKVMFKHILPNAITPILIAFSFSVGGAILGVASLSYLGFGDETICDWGTDINWAMIKLMSKPWISLWPGFLIAITVFGFLAIGDGIRDALDPKYKKK